jgi:hypothetical protein
MRVVMIPSVFEISITSLAHVVHQLNPAEV